MKIKSYKLDEIQENDNLLFNLRLDIMFKKVFLNNKSLPYLCLLISLFYNISYDDLIKEAIIVNGELPNKMIDKESSRTDLVVRFRNIDFIIEMNHIGKDYTIEKNTSYLFNLQTSKASNENKYGKYLFTYLLNIDDYDVLEQNDFSYESGLDYKKYNRRLYENIKTNHINLASLIKKYYNKEETELTNLEKLLLIFIEQRKDKIRSIIKISEIEGVIEIMEKLKLDTKLPTYDKEELDRLERISFEEKKKEFNKNQEEFNKNQEEFNKNQEEFNKNQEEFNKNQEKFNKNQEEFNKNQEKFNNNRKEFYQEKFELAKKLIKIGFSKDEIKKITKLSSKQLSLM